MSYNLDGFELKGFKNLLRWFKNLIDTFPHINEANKLMKEAMSK